MTKMFISIFIAAWTAIVYGKYAQVSGSPEFDIMYHRSPLNKSIKAIHAINSDGSITIETPMYHDANYRPHTLLFKNHINHFNLICRYFLGAGAQPVFYTDGMSLGRARHHIAFEEGGVFFTNTIQAPFKYVKSITCRFPGDHVFKNRNYKKKGNKFKKIRFAWKETLFKIDAQTPSNAVCRSFGFTSAVPETLTTAKSLRGGLVLLDENGHFQAVKKSERYIRSITCQ